MSGQLDLFLYSMELDELQTVTRERGAVEAEASGVSLTATLELGEAMHVARTRLPSNQAYGEWWAGVGLNYSLDWRAKLVKIGKRWIDEGRPVIMSHDNGTGARFSLDRYAAGGDPYQPDDDEPGGHDDNDDPAPVSESHGDEWYTPSWLFHALGLTFDLDPCAPADLTHETVPALKRYSLPTDGLLEPWNGLVWVNPPYSAAGPWAERMIEHGNGLLLTHVPINGGWCLDVWRNCDAMCQFGGMHFVRPDGASQRPAWWLQLAAFGPVATDALRAMPARLPDDLEARWRPGPVWVSPVSGL